MGARRNMSWTMHAAGMLLHLALVVALPRWMTHEAAAQPASAMLLSLVDPAEASLPADPSFNISALDNGVRVILRRQSSEAGPAVVRLHVEAGSLYESDEEPATAFVSAMLFSAIAADQSAGKAVRALGGALPTPAEAMVPSIDQSVATFTIRLPIADDPALSLALAVLRDIARGADVDETVLLERRAGLLARRAALDTTRERLLAIAAPQIIPGSRLLAHPTLPSEAQICQVAPSAVTRFHERCYAPARLTIIIVADAPVENTKALVRAAFADLTPGPGADPSQAPERSDVSVGLRGAVVAHPELLHATAEIISIHPADPPMRNFARWREHLVESLASGVLEQRLARLADLDDAPIVGHGVTIRGGSGPTRVAVASIAGAASTWPALMSRLAATVAQSRFVEPSGPELGAASAAILESIDREARRDSSAPPIELVERASDAVRTGDILLNHADQVALARVMLPGIEPHEVTRTLSDRFSIANAAFVLFLPVTETAPSATALLASSLPSLLARPQARTGDDFADLGALLPSAAQAPSPPESMRFDPRSGITAAALAQGPALSHLRLPSSGRVILGVAFTYPSTPDDRPSYHRPVAAASIFWAEPATRTIDAATFRRLLSRAGISLSYALALDHVRVELSAPPDRMEVALQCLRALLTEPAVDAAAFERWSNRVERMRAASRADASVAADLELAQMLGGIPSPGAAPMTLEEAQLWVDQTIRGAAPRLVIVGDIERATALDLATRSLSHTAEVPRPSADPASLGACAGAFREDSLRRNAASAGTHAAVVIAVHGAAREEERPALDLASRVLQQRLDSLRADSNGPFLDVGVRHSGAAAGGAPLLMVVGTGRPGSTIAMGAAIERTITDLARRGPTDDELVRARALEIEAFDADAPDAAWWARQILFASMRGARLQSREDLRARIASFTAADVRAVLAAHDPETCCNAPRLRITVEPPDTP